MCKELVDCTYDEELTCKARPKEDQHGLNCKGREQEMQGWCPILPANLVTKPFCPHKSL